MKKKTKFIIFFTVLGLLILCSTSYIIYSKYQTKKEESKMIEHKKYADKEYWKSVENILKDEYINKIISFIMVRDKTTPSIVNYFVVPSKIDGYTLDTIKPEDFYREHGKIYDYMQWAIPEKNDIVVSIYGDKYIKIKNITNTETGKIEYKEQDNSFSFKSVGYGKYIIELEVNKSDIFYVVFC